MELYYALRPAIPRWLAYRIESYDGNSQDRGDLDLATDILAADCFDDIRAVVKQAMPDADQLKYRWDAVDEHLESCLILCAPHIVEIRPIIPPTMTHFPFAGANQRIYMSATLGEDGDIERSFGVGKFNLTFDPPVQLGKASRDTLGHQDVDFESRVIQQSGEFGVGELLAAGTVVIPPYRVIQKPIVGDGRLLNMDHDKPFSRR
jgi:hypothetical protein